MVMSMFLGGCGENQTSTGSEQEALTQETDNSGVVHLKVWSDESHFELLQKMVDSFQEKYASEATFEVTFENVSESGTRDAILGDIYNTADVFAFADDQINSLAAGAVLDEVKNEEVAKANLPAAVTEELSATMTEIGNFVNSGVQYKENATYIENAMNDFSKKTDELKQAMDGIATSINTITLAIDDGAKGVTGAADSTQILVSDMENITNRMDENQNIANSLHKETEIFTKF